jgi:hypothetical protein
MEMQGLKPSVLMGKLKQHLPPGVSPYNDLFLAMFLIRLPSSMRETVGAGAHGTAAAMVKATDALRAATILRSQPPRHSKAGAPLPAAGREATKGAVTPSPEVAPLPAQISTLFRTLAMACANFTITMPIRLTGAFRPVFGGKSNSPPDPFRFGSFPHTCHCHGYAFSHKRWLDFFD